jgi:hypothetical protein
VQWYRVNTKDPVAENAISREQQEQAPRNISAIRNQEAIAQTQDEIDRSLRDFYTDYDPLKVTVLDRQDYERTLRELSDRERELLMAGKNYYQLDFKNEGGLVMPIILQFEYVDGTKEEHRIPAEIWRYNNYEVSKVFVTEKEIRQIVLDPYLETADTDRTDNYFPARQEMNRFELFRQRPWNQGENPMQRARRAEQPAKPSGGQ